ncbi:MAG: peptide deformylase [Rubrobacteraceae bacterium]
MSLEIRTFGDPVLKTRAPAVDRFDDNLKLLAREMLETMREYEGVGLAANQVGRLKRILVAALEDEEYVLVNPKVTAAGPESEKEIEGCLSIPEIQVEIERPSRVTVAGQNLLGEHLSLEATGLLARILQHEVDHLDGVLILDRTDRESRKAALRELRGRLLTQR